MSALLHAAVEALLATSVAIVIVLALRPAWRRAFGAEAVVALWAAVPAAVVAVAIPARVVVAGAAQGAHWSAPAAAESIAASGAATSVLPHLVLAVWLLGTLVAASLHVWAQRRFIRQLAPFKPGADHAYRSASTQFGAVVIGVIRPRIVLPADFEQRYTPQQQALILLHEQSHVARADLLANWIAAAFRCAFWFNPLVHYAARCLSRDQEIASDAAVIRAKPHLRGLYANTLLHDHLDGARTALARQWGRKPIEERITMLGAPAKSPTSRRVGGVLAAAMTLALAASAWAAQPPRVEPGTAAWSSTVINVRGNDLTLRQAVEVLAAAAEVSVADGHLLDDARPDADLEFAFTDIPASTALEIMLEEVSAKLDYTLEPEGVRFIARK